MREQTCCFTGHRLIPAYEKERLNAELLTSIASLIQKGVTCFRNGGALGFDTAAALAVLDIKRNHPAISLIMDLPCQNQARGWKKSDQAVYDFILSSADEVHFLAPHYYNGCMQLRNRHMVDRSAYLIAYQTSPAGGSAYTVRYAQEQGLTLIRLGNHQ